MSDDEPISPIARKLLGGDSDVPDRHAPCCVCGKQTVLPGFIFESVRLWNRQEDEIATAENRRAKYITTHELGMCCPGDCTRIEYERRRAASESEGATTDAFLRMLRAGKYNPESLAWLRSHGKAKEVARLLAKEGTTKVHE